MMRDTSTPPLAPRGARAVLAEGSARALYRGLDTTSRARRSSARRDGDVRRVKSACATRGWSDGLAMVFTASVAGLRHHHHDEPCDQRAR